MIRNLLTSLFTHKKIKTTRPRGEITRSLAEKLLTKIKRKDDMNAVRAAKDVLLTKEASKNAISLAKDLKRTSGYIRMTNVGVRDGDNAPMVIIEFIKD